MSGDNNEDDCNEEQIGARVSERVKEAVEEVALKRSEPGDMVTNSDVVRDALVYYLDELAASEFRDE